MAGTGTPTGGVVRAAHSSAVHATPHATPHATLAHLAGPSPLPTPTGARLPDHLPSRSELAGWLGQLADQHRLPLIATVLTILAWWVAYRAMLLVTRPLPVAAEPPSQQLPGDEPPAVVSVLAGGWSVTEDAAESTLLDLAARGYLDLQQPDADPRHVTVHVSAQDPATASAVAARRARVQRAAGGEVALTWFEQLVFDHVQRVAVGGVVPLTALTFRDADASAEWWTSFGSAVEDDAKRRGLIRRRVPAAAVVALHVAAAAPALAVVWLEYSLLTVLVPSLMLISFLGVLGVLGRAAARSRGYRPTPAGRAAAARWFGLRDYLRVDQAFAALPPSAVAVWDRYLAYGDALGVTHVCSAVIDLGMANRRRVWSSFGGGWHQVRVRYPGSASRYGITATALISQSVVQVGFAVGVLWAYRRPELAALRAVSPWTELIELLGVAVLLYGGYRLVRGVLDLATPRTLTAQVLWLSVWRTATRNEHTTTTLHYLAVDDGSADRTTAWALPDGLQTGIAPGDAVRITVRPWTRRVTALHRLPADDVPLGADAGRSVAGSGG